MLILSSVNYDHEFEFLKAMAMHIILTKLLIIRIVTSSYTGFHWNTYLKNIVALKKDDRVYLGCQKA